MSFQSPIGTEALRATGKIWPGSWLDATGFLKKYAIGIHTGADLNLPGDADRDSPVYAIGDGTVTYAQTYPNQNAWGNIIVINHGIVDGKPLFSRYGHVGKILVSVGQSVRTGDHISFVGNGNGLFAYHLHFDISTTDILKSRPGNWPAPSTNPDPSLVQAHYVDPLRWLQDHFVYIPPPPQPPLDLTRDRYVIATYGLSVREQPSTSANRVVMLSYGSKVLINDEKVENPYIWGQLSQLPYRGLWIALRKSDNSEVYVSDAPPFLPDLTKDRYVIATNGLNIRDQPSTSANKVVTLPYGSKVLIEDETVEKNSYIWGQLSQLPYRGLWVALRKSDNSEVYVSNNPPPPNG